MKNKGVRKEVERRIKEKKEIRKEEGKQIERKKRIEKWKEDWTGKKRKEKIEIKEKNMK